MDCLQDTHPKVAAAAAATLADVAAVISQPEIQKNMSTLIDALSKPEQKTAACLEKVRARKWHGCYPALLRRSTFRE
jgi:hypothetical protein